MNININKKLITLSALTILLSFPVVIWAAIPFPKLLPGSGDVVGAIEDLLYFYIWPIFAAVSVIMTIMVGFMFLTSQGDPSKAVIARKALMYVSLGIGIGLCALSIPFIISFILSDV